MAITRLHTSTSGTITSTTYGNLLVVYYYGSASAPTDNAPGNSSVYTVVSVTNGTSIASIAYVLKIPASVTTVTPPAGGTIVGVVEYTGGTGAGVFKFDNSGTGTATGSDTTPIALSAALTPAAANELVVAVTNGVRTTGTKTITAVTTPTSFTLVNSITGATPAEGSWDWIQTTATGTTASSAITYSGAGAAGFWSWAEAVAAFSFSPYFTHLQGNSGTSATGSTTATVTLSASPTLGNLVCVGFHIMPYTVTGFTLKDSNNNTYTLVPTSPFTNSATNDFSILAYLLSAPSSASGTLTASWTGTSTNYDWFIDEFTVTNGPALFDTSIGGTGTTGTTINSPSITPSVANELLYAHGISSVTISAPVSGATLGVWTGAGPISNGNQAEYVINGTAAATAVNFTQGSAAWTSQVMAFSVYSAHLLSCLGAGV